jgi:hypothetical protein
MVEVWVVVVHKLFEVPLREVAWVSDGYFDHRC